MMKGALLENLAESKRSEIRLDILNAFNHPEFYCRLSVDGNISDSTVGPIVSAAAPRSVQITSTSAF